MPINSSANTDSEIWTVAEAKARLSELLRLAEDKPQFIGTKKPYVVISAEQWEKILTPTEPMGKWLVESMIGTGELELPDREDPPREIPFH